MTWDDDDACYLQAARRATELRDTRFMNRETPHPSAVPVRAEPVPGMRAFTLEQVSTGWPLYSTSRYVAEDEPLGGVCVEVVHDRLADPDTGELYERTAYRCLSWWRPSKPWTYLDAGEVDLAQLAGLDRQASTAAIFWLLRPFAMRRQRKWLQASDIETIHDAWRLAAAVAL